VRKSNSCKLGAAIQLRKQFVLDRLSNERLEKLASSRGGDASLVIREAIQVYWDTEARLEKIETDPDFQAMMKQSEKAIHRGRVTSHKEVLRMSRERSKRNKHK
jgi:predicted transcriptional regulator